MGAFLNSIILLGKVQLDNITHSLFGAAVSESLWTLLPETKKKTFHPKTRRILLLTSVIANNFPDSDILYSRWMHSNPQLGNLLHHRGHTHTILIALLQAFLLIGLTKVIQKIRSNPLKEEWGYISLLAFAGPLTHILLDGLNNYGVHPLWPFDNGWKYGDLIFVLEPWAWVSLSLFLYFSDSTKKMKVLCAFLLFLGLGLSLFLGVVPLAMCLVLLIWACGFILVMKNAKPRARVAWNWLLLVFVLGVFRWGYLETRLQINAELKNNAEDYRLEDVSLSPLPVNPFCWAIVTSESNSDFFRIRRGIVAPFSKILPLEKCLNLTFFSAGVREVKAKGNRIWEKEHLVSLAELRQLREKYCDVRDFLKFSRAPFFWRDGNDLYFSDLRFERNGGKSFAKIKISERTDPCIDPRAPWVEPRYQLFFESSSR